MLIYSALSQLLSTMIHPDKVQEKIHYAIEITIRLAFLLILVVWCFSLLAPFSSIVLWAAILAIAGNPVYKWFLKITGGKKKLSGFLFILCGLVIIIVPSWIFMDSLISGVSELKSGLENQSLSVPPPEEKVKDWPFIGERAYAIWNEASANLDNFLANYHEQITNFSESIFNSVLNIGGAILGFVLSTIIAGILLITPGTDGFFRKFFDKLMGKNGSDIQEIITRTVSNVTRGVIGVSIIQALLVGIGFLLAGIPYAGIWALLTFVLALLQLPISIITIPAIFYLFSVDSGLMPVIWTIYLFLAGISDNVLKPLLLGKGAPVPILVIFLGVLGGFMLSGFIGLFTGAIVLSIGYRLFISWIDGSSSTSAAPEPVDMSK